MNNVHLISLGPAKTRLVHHQGTKHKTTLYDVVCHPHNSEWTFSSVQPSGLTKVGLMHHQEHQNGTWLASTPALPRSAVLLSKRLFTCTARRQSSCHTPLSARFSLK